MDTKNELHDIAKGLLDIRYSIVKMEEQTSALTTKARVLHSSMDSFESLELDLKKAVALLNEILPMQGCIQCQEIYMPCSVHGSILETTKKIGEFLKRMI